MLRKREPVPQPLAVPDGVWRMAIPREYVGSGSAWAQLVMEYELCGLRLEEWGEVVAVGDE